MKGFSMHLNKKEFEEILKEINKRTKEKNGILLEVIEEIKEKKFTCSLPKQSK